MSYLSGKNRGQGAMFPARIDDWIEEGNPVRFLDAFVETLDLRELGFGRAEEKAMGRPAYHPGVLLRLYLYGYLNNIRSSRKLERESKRNVELMWLLEMLSPDHKTIADFRKDNLEPLKKVCREFTELCKRMGLFGGQLIGVDGSKFKAVNSPERNFGEKKLTRLIQRIDEHVEKYLGQLEAADQEEEGESQKPTAAELQEKIEELKKRKTVHQERQEALRGSKEKQISLTDKDARMMKTREGHGVCYNVQMAVDKKHKLIVACEVTNACSDQGQLSDIAQQAKEALGVEELEVTADMGYYECADVKACETAGITVFMQKPSLSSKTGLYTKDDFTYKSEKDVYVCPAGQELAKTTQGKEKGRETKYYMTPACLSCPQKSRCTKAKQRRIKRLADEAVVERLAARTRANPEKLKLRKQLCEHPFGTIKRWMDQGFFLMRGKSKVGTEMRLTAMAYNLKRVIRIKGVDAMLEALG